MKTTETAVKATATKEAVNNREAKAAEAKVAATVFGKAQADGNGKAGDAEQASKSKQAVPKALGAAVAGQPEAAGAPKATEQPKQQHPAMNLEETLKLVEELHRRKRQRDRLIETIDNLESFEVEQKEDADETDGNYYQGCKLTIEDDNRNQFATKNPVIIQAVAAFVTDMCRARLGEIESEIQIPV